MAAALPVMMMVAGGVAAAGAVAQGIGKMNADNYNSQVDNNQAVATEEAAAERGQQQKTETQRTIGEALAVAGASGVDPGQGSPLTVMSDIATQGELNRQLTVWQGSSEAAALRQKGLLDKMAGQQALIGGIAQAGSTLLTAGTAYSKLPTGDSAGGLGQAVANSQAPGGGFNAF